MPGVNTGHRLPATTLTRLQHALKYTDWGPTRIGSHLKISPRTVNRIRLSYELFGTPNPPGAVRVGRSPVLTSFKAQIVLKYVTEIPDAYLDEIAWYVYDITGKVVVDRTIWNVLSRAGWTRKVARRIAGERHAGLRQFWQTKKAY